MCYIGQMLNTFKLPHSDNVTDFIMREIDKDTLKKSEYVIHVPDSKKDILVWHAKDSEESHMVPMHIEKTMQRNEDVVAFLLYHPAHMQWCYKYVPMTTIHRDLSHLRENEIEEGYYSMSALQIVNYNSPKAVLFEDIKAP